MKNVKVLVIDYGGIYGETAVRFMRDCDSVKYCTYSDAELAGKIGLGLDGVERVDSPFPHIDDVDFIFCPDTNSGDLVEWLKKHDYPVAGAGAVEKLEIDRKWARWEVQAKRLPVQATVWVKGVEMLKDVCQYPDRYFDGGVKQFFVKVDNGYRGFSESFKHLDYETSLPRIKYLDFKTGPFADEIEFICEELLEGVEPGFDGATFDGEIVFPTLAGYEIGKKSQIDRVYRTADELPQVYKTIHDGFKPEFEKHKTRFFYSDEMIIDKNGTPFLIDPTMRMPSPGGVSLQTEVMENFTEFCHGLATGNLITPIMKFKYALASPLTTLEAEKGFVTINFPKEMRQWIKLTQACKVKKDYYAIPPEPIVATVVALGNTIQETIGLCKERLSEVEFEGKTCDDAGLDKIMDKISEGKKLGINF